MNKFLKILGGIFLALLIVAGIAAAIIIPKAWTLNKNAIAYFETNVPILVESWNSEELVKRAAPEILVEATKEQMPKMFLWLSKLGKLKKLDTPVGQVTTGYYPGTQFKGTWADYVANAEFEAGSAQIKLVLKRNGDGWQIMGFHINSPALLASNG